MITELFSHINQNIADQNMRQDSHQIFYCTRNPHLFSCIIFHGYPTQIIAVTIIIGKHFAGGKKKKTVEEQELRYFSSSNHLKPYFCIQTKQLVYSLNILIDILHLCGTLEHTSFGICIIGI